MTAGRTADEREALRRRGLWLEYITIAWNIGEAVVTVTLGVLAGSIALVAFGTDSMIEVFASGVVVWHHRHPEASAERTRTATRLIAAAFLTLGTVLAISAIRQLMLGLVADESLPGILYLAAVVVVMLVLARLKRETGEALDSRPLQAEARITLLDAALASGVLVALLLNVLFGWWWADPVAALVVAVVAINEGREAWVGEVAGIPAD